MCGVLSLFDPDASIQWSFSILLNVLNFPGRVTLIPSDRSSNSTSVALCIYEVYDCLECRMLNCPGLGFVVLSERTEGEGPFPKFWIEWRYVVPTESKLKHFVLISA